MNTKTHKVFAIIVGKQRPQLKHSRTNTHLHKTYWWRNLMLLRNIIFRPLFTLSLHLSLSLSQWMQMNRNDGNHINSLIIVCIMLDTMNVCSWWCKGMFHAHPLMYSMENYRISWCNQRMKKKRKQPQNKFAFTGMLYLIVYATLQCFAIDAQFLEKVIIIIHSILIEIRGN